MAILAMSCIFLMLRQQGASAMEASFLTAFAPVLKFWIRSLALAVAIVLSRKG